jgi:hypothetical protein
VKQGCLLSELLFLLAIDWLIKRVSEKRETGIECINGEILEDLDYTDHLGLFSDDFEDTQEKMTRLGRTGKKLGLKVSAKKTEILLINSWNDRKVMLEDQALKDCEKFTFLGSMVSQSGGTEEDMNNRVNKARNAFIGLQ